MRIFLSYRRDDSAGYAGRLYDRLSQHFGADSVFMDVKIPLGEDFAKVIGERVASCDVLIALIGKQWLSMTDEGGQRRLNDPDDWVNLEVATALNRDVRVIPVLVRGAHMPEVEELPDVLAGLARRQALSIDDARFHEDANRLIEAIGGGAVQPAQTAPVDHPKGSAGSAATAAPRSRPRGLRRVLGSILVGAATLLCLAYTGVTIAGFASGAGVDWNEFFFFSGLAVVIVLVVGGVGLLLRR
jgi:hypothetical protein